MMTLNPFFGGMMVDRPRNFGFCPSFSPTMLGVYASLGFPARTSIPQRHSLNQRCRPETEFAEDADAYYILVKLPNSFNSDDVSVDVRGEELIVSGQKYVMEVDLLYQVARRVPGPAFRRMYRIPRDVAVDNIAATVEGSVLVVQLPKVQEERVFFVRINTPRVVKVVPQLVACAAPSPPARHFPTRAVQTQSKKQERLGAGVQAVPICGVLPQPAALADIREGPVTSESLSSPPSAVYGSASATSEGAKVLEHAASGEVNITASTSSGLRPPAEKEVSTPDAAANLQIDVEGGSAASEIPVIFENKATAESSSTNEDAAGATAARSSVDEDAAGDSFSNDEDDDEEKDGSWVDVSDEEPKVSSKGKGPLKAAILEAVNYEAEAELLRNRGSVYSSDSE